MKKQLLFALAVLGVITAAKAQKPDTARLMVHYKFTYVDDTTDRAHPHTENMVLYVGKSAGAYWSYDMIEANEQFKKAYAAAVAASPDGHPMINRMNRGSQTQYFQYPNEQKMLVKDNLFFNTYVIENPLPVIDWKISSDTATFGGLHCQKATCHFKGRDYIAWFSPDLPVRVGPWKLIGLPGVIVDAHDVKNEVVFKFDGIEKTVLKPIELSVSTNVEPKDQSPILRDLDYDPNIIAPPSGTIKTTQAEFDKLRAAMKKDPQAFADPMRIKIKKGPASGSHAINNPIELPEK
jgi:GLPGLI family protein